MPQLADPPAALTDEFLREVEADLLFRLRSYLRAVVIERTDCGVVLRGTAFSFYGKQLAQHEVRRRSGARVVSNRIKVADTPLVPASRPVAALA